MLKLNNVFMSEGPVYLDLTNELLLLPGFSQSNLVHDLGSRYVPLPRRSLYILLIVLELVAPSESALPQKLTLPVPLEVWLLTEFSHTLRNHYEICICV